MMDLNFDSDKADLSIETADGDYQPFLCSTDFGIAPATFRRCYLHPRATLVAIMLSGSDFLSQPLVAVGTAA
jgi:hypothetical protein